MRQDILQRTQKLIALFNRQQIEDELYSQLQTLEKIILEDEEKAFVFIQPFVNNLFEAAEKRLKN